MRPEEHSKKDLARNNFDDGKSLQDHKLIEGKVDAFVEVKISKKDPKLQEETVPDRGVYRYKGDLNLKDFDHQFGKHSGKKDGK